MPTRRTTITTNPAGQPAEPLTLGVDDAGPTTVIHAAGDLDLSTGHLLTDLVDALLGTEPPKVVVLDLAGLRFFCADGIRALLHVRDAATAHAAHLTVRDPAPVVVTVLGITRMLDAFDIETDRSVATMG
jgi:anti-anti-sigma factor